MIRRIASWLLTLCLMAAVLLLALFVLTLPVAPVFRSGISFYLAQKVFERLSMGRWFADLGVSKRWTSYGVAALVCACGSAALCRHHWLTKLAPMGLVAAIVCLESAVLLMLRRNGK